MSDQLVEKDWRDKEKLVEGLKDTVDKQKKDLNIVQKEIMKKDMLCSALKVSRLLLKPIFYTDLYHNMFVCLAHFHQFFIETDDIPRDAAEWSYICQGGGSETQDQTEDLWKVSAVIQVLSFFRL